MPLVGLPGLLRARCCFARAQAVVSANAGLQAEFFVDLVESGGDGVAGVVVAADGDVGVVGSVEGVTAGRLLLEEDSAGVGLRANAEKVRCQSPRRWASSLSSVPMCS